MEEESCLKTGDVRRWGGRGGSWKSAEIIGFLAAVLSDSTKRKRLVTLVRSGWWMIRWLCFDIDCTYYLSVSSTIDK